VLIEIKKELKNFSSKKQAKVLSSFFKTGKGQYGEGDKFLGIKVPILRKIAKKYFNCTMKDIKKLLSSKFHEERLLALFLLTYKYKTGDDPAKGKIFNVYLKNTKFINNWDLVDLSAEHIVGDFLFSRKKDILFSLAKSKNIWERRIAILATFCFIKKGKYKETFKIAKTLLNDRHDLIHKAVGWMLREVGKRCSLKAEESFLKKYHKKMPRTMLRYTIERFPEKRKQIYM